MKNLFKSMLLALCLLHIPIVFAIEKEEKKIRKSSIKRIMGIVGITTFLGLNVISGSLQTRREETGVFYLLLPVVGRHLAGESSKRSAFEGLLAGFVAALAVSLEKNKKSINEFSKKTCLSGQGLFFLINSCLAGTSVGLTELGIRKLEEYEKVKVRTEPPSKVKAMAGVGVAYFMANSFADYLRSKEYVDQLFALGINIMGSTIGGHLAGLGVKESIVSGGLAVILTELACEQLKLYEKSEVIHQAAHLTISVATAGLIELAKRKWEEHKSKKDKQEENLNSKISDLEKRYYEKVK